MSEKQTVFISWSKPLSKDVGLALKSWLPNIFDKAEGWVSDADIAAGAQTYSTIAGALSDSVFGIIIVTALNQNEPWLNYEAGALSNKFAGDQTCVAPLLVDLRKADLTSPLKQYQANDLDQDGVLKVCKAMAPIMGTDIAAVEKRVGMFWPELGDAVEAAKAESAARDMRPSETPKREPDDILAEVLTTVRDLSRRLDLRSNNSYWLSSGVRRSRQTSFHNARIMAEALSAEAWGPNVFIRQDDDGVTVGVSPLLDEGEVERIRDAVNQLVNYLGDESPNVRLVREYPSYPRAASRDGGPTHGVVAGD